MIRKIAVFLLLAAMLAVGVYLLPPASPAAAPQAGKIQVSASFYPMGEFARQVGGDRVIVSVVVRPGVEPHDYDPTPRDITQIHQSKVLIYNGADLEPWAQRLAPELEVSGTVVVAAGNAALAGQVSDPHIWLDPVLASREVEAIAAGFIRADPAGEAVYRRNAAAYQRKLAALDRSYAAGLTTCAQHTVITAHQALGYLAKRYHFQALGIAGLSPDEEPSPAKLAEVAQSAQQYQVHYIFFETLASPKLADTIAHEVGAQTLIFNPLEGLSEQEIASGQNYLTVQYRNIENLRTALNCT